MEEKSALPEANMKPPYKNSKMDYTKLLSQQDGLLPPERGEESRAIQKVT
jgi:hypothetical protein